LLSSEEKHLPFVYIIVRVVVMTFTHRNVCEVLLIHETV